MKILSLFDGISCARVAAERAGCNVERYVASEVDKYAVAVAKDNFPDTEEIGSVTEVDGAKYHDFDLLIGGSPCQDLSVAGKRKGLQGERSGLFWEYVRILKEANPRYFILENVFSMKDTDRDIISEALGVKPIMIDATLVSAQSRKRYFWTNINGVKQPIDKGIVLKDVLQGGTVDRDKSYCIDACYYKGASWEQYKKKGRRQLVIRDGVVGKLTPIECERLQGLPDNYTLAPGKHPVYKNKPMSNTQRYKMLGNAFNVDVVAHMLSFIKKD